ncbi:MAG TPA: hypothetical protein DIT50_03055 [Rhodocyclaceae bacterium]|nr:hypothetical protein [Rhodocyclaceae bacterium]
MVGPSSVAQSARNRLSPLSACRRRSPWGRTCRCGLWRHHPFNQKLAQWLIDYNTVLPHHSLDLKAPVQWLMENHKECQRYWTNTIRKAVSEWLAHQSQPQWPEIVVNFQGMADRREPRPTETARRGSTGMR